MTKSPKILIIDDEPEICSLLRFLLTRDGFDPHVADTSEAALHMILTSDFEGVVCDFAMPGMDGITLLKKVRAEKNFTPFIFLSGHANFKEAHEMINLGAHELIQKPHVKLIAPALRNLLKNSFELKCLENSGVQGEDFLMMLHEAKKPA